ncbi:hypothetical protein ACFQZC_08750 [Streptacidiphilus monticola]
MAQVVFGAADGVQASELGQEAGVAQVEVFVVGVEADGVGEVEEGFLVREGGLVGEGVEAVEEALAQVLAVDLDPFRAVAVQEGPVCREAARRQAASLVAWSGASWAWVRAVRRSARSVLMSCWLSFQPVPVERKAAGGWVVPSSSRRMSRA